VSVTNVAVKLTVLRLLLLAAQQSWTTYLTSVLASQHAGILTCMVLGIGGTNGTMAGISLV
jgi:hypothetical protein